jgi:hypothetical protein
VLDYNEKKNLSFKVKPKLSIKQQPVLDLASKQKL